MRQGRWQRQVGWSHGALALRRGLLFLLGTAAALSAGASGPAAGADDVEVGRRIYRDGLLPSGAPLTGKQLGGSMVSGSAAACVHCHRRSGMGAVEGDIPIPPVTGNHLFGRGGKNMATTEPHRGQAASPAHDPHTEQSLAAAIRHGVNRRGGEMSAAMPRYDLDERALKGLIAYLGQLSPRWSPGVGERNIRFATVITPGAEPERRQALLNMMRAAFAQKNGSTTPGRRHLVSPAELLMRTERTWSLDVWELQGAPETWRAQLEENYRRQPVFALVSGLASGTWQPVHDFCEREGVPCWFPSVELPPTAAPGFYPVYFSRGVALEADVLARHLIGMGKQKPQRVVQVFRDDDVGRGAARAMRRALAGSGIGVEDRLFDLGAELDPTYMLVGVEKNDAVMFWLRPADVARLEPVWPGPVNRVYFSAALGGAERAPMPASWKGKAQLVYPYELPERRRANLGHFHQWLNTRNLALVDEALQSEVYFALTFLTDTLAEMLDNLYRDYLVERAEHLLSRREGGRVGQEEEARPRLTRQANGGPLRPQLVRAMAIAQELDAAPLPGEAAPGRHERTTIYPRLGLGPAQRFASKGGYIVRFADIDSDRLVAESEWIVP